MDGPAPTNHKLQLLADALALGFSDSQARAQCCRALQQLLPGLEYLSVSVYSSAQGGILSSSTGGTGVPSALHMHGLASSAAGAAVHHGRAVHANLAAASSASAAAATAWSDVQLMMQHAPHVAHALCIPFGCQSNVDAQQQQQAGGAGEAGPSHPQRNTQDGAQGALLLGFSVLPSLEGRRGTLLALLAQHLPGPMARASAQVLSCLSHPGYSSSTSSDLEEEEGQEGDEMEGEEEEEGEGEEGGEGVQAALARQRRGSCSWEDSDSSGGDEEETEGRHALRVGACAAAGDGEAGPSSCPGGAAPGSRRCGRGRWLSQHGPLGDYTVSKELLAEAAKERGALQPRPFWQGFSCFSSTLAEQEYLRWSSQALTKEDKSSSIVVLASLLVLAAAQHYVQPYRLVNRLDVLFASLAFGLVLPLALLLLGKKRYTDWREQLIAIFRLTSIVVSSRMALPAVKVQALPNDMKHWVTFWRLAGCESLFFNAIAFQVRLKLHVPLQLAVTACAVVANLQAACTQFYHSPDKLRMCILNGTVMAFACGFLLPTLALLRIEHQSRKCFVKMVRSAGRRQHVS